MNGGESFPEVRLVSKHIEAKVYLPDPQRGYYRGTRFDWSGVLSSLECGGHQYFGRWYTHRDPSVRDFVFAGPDIVAGSASAITGPAEEFVTPQGYAAAAAGDTFVKIGVGVLRKPDAAAYSCYNRYEVVDSGTWTVQSDRGSIEFTQVLSERSTIFSYVYRKTVRLLDDRPQMTIEHSLRNTGSGAMRTAQYNHNFLTLDARPIGPDHVITLPFQIRAVDASPYVELHGNQVTYRSVLAGEDVAACALRGFGATADDYDVRIEDRKSGAGVRIAGDRPLADLALWSIRSVLSVEPFVNVAVEPSKESSWSYQYEFYTMQQ